VEHSIIRLIGNELNVKLPQEEIYRLDLEMVIAGVDLGVEELANLNQQATRAAFFVGRACNT
jgi:hypothetical protein